jgi:hypothetical protein
MQRDNWLKLFGLLTVAMFFECRRQRRTRRRRRAPRFFAG